MKTIKKEIEVPACDICGKELNEALQHYKISKENGGGDNGICCHGDCVMKLVINNLFF